MKKENLKQKFLQLFTIGYNSTIPNESFLSLIQNGLGGIIFFAENFEFRSEFKKQINEFNTLSKIPLFLSIDQEGGLVERTIFLDKKIEYLSPKTLSKLKRDDVLLHYDILCKDLNDLGINLNFAPVVDVNSNPKNPIIGIRSFGNNPQIVSEYSKYAIESHKNNKIISCAKHFPGHGDTSIDSHLNMPFVDMPFDEFYRNHLICFKNAIKNGIDAIMISHIHFSFFDKEKTPASLSQNVINYLKHDLNFKGLIFSDDMVMGGISKHYGLKESILLGLNAGIDNFIFRNYSSELENAINQILSLALKDKNLFNKIQTAYEKTIAFKKKNLKLNSQNFLANMNFDCEEHQKTIDEIAKKVFPVNFNKENLKIRTNTNIKIVSFDFRKIFNLSNNKTNLKYLLQEYYPTDEILYPLNPSNDDITKILNRIHNKDVVIFLSYNPQVNDKQIELFNKIQSRKILVDCGLESNIRLSDYNFEIISIHSPKSSCLKALANLFIQK